MIFSNEVLKNSYAEPNLTYVFKSLLFKFSVTPDDCICNIRDCSSVKVKPLTVMGDTNVLNLVL